MADKVNFSLEGVYGKVDIIKGDARNLNFIEVMLLISELPNILPLKYPAVKDIINACIQLLPQVKKFIHSTITTDKTMLQWKNFTKYDYILRILQNVKI